MRWLNYIIILVSLIVCHYPFCLLLCLFESHLWYIIPITIVPVLGSVERQARSSWSLVRAWCISATGCAVELVGMERIPTNPTGLLAPMRSDPAFQPWSLRGALSFVVVALQDYILVQGKHPAAMTSTTTCWRFVKGGISQYHQCRNWGNALEIWSVFYTFLGFTGDICRPWPRWLHEQIYTET